MISLWSALRSIVRRRRWGGRAETGRSPGLRLRGKKRSAVGLPTDIWTWFYYIVTISQGLKQIQRRQAQVLFRSSTPQLFPFYLCLSPLSSFPSSSLPWSNYIPSQSKDRLYWKLSFPHFSFKFLNLLYPLLSCFFKKIRTAIEKIFFYFKVDSGWRFEEITQDQWHRKP